MRSYHAAAEIPAYEEHQDEPGTDRDVANPASPMASYRQNGSQRDVGPRHPWPSSSRVLAHGSGASQAKNRSDSHGPNPARGVALSHRITETEAMRQQSYRLVDDSGMYSIPRADPRSVSPMAGRNSAADDGRNDFEGDGNVAPHTPSRNSRTSAAGDRDYQQGHSDGSDENMKNRSMLRVELHGRSGTLTARQFTGGGAEPVPGEAGGHLATSPAYRSSRATEVGRGSTPKNRSGSARESSRPPRGADEDVLHSQSPSEASEPVNADGGRRSQASQLNPNADHSGGARQSSRAASQRSVSPSAHRSSRPMSGHFDLPGDVPCPPRTPSARESASRLGSQGNRMGPPADAVHQPELPHSQLSSPSARENASRLGSQGNRMGPPVDAQQSELPYSQLRTPSARENASHLGSQGSRIGPTVDAHQSELPPVLRGSSQPPADDVPDPRLSEDSQPVSDDEAAVSPDREQADEGARSSILRQRGSDGSYSPERPKSVQWRDSRGEDIASFDYGDQRPSHKQQSVRSQRSNASAGYWAQYPSYAEDQGWDLQRQSVAATSIRQPTTPVSHLETPRPGSRVIVSSSTAGGEVEAEVVPPKYSGKTSVQYEAGGTTCQKHIANDRLFDTILAVLDDDQYPDAPAEHPRNPSGRPSANARPSRTDQSRSPRHSSSGDGTRNKKTSAVVSPGGESTQSMSSGDTGKDSPGADWLSPSARSGSARGTPSGNRISKQNAASLSNPRDSDSVLATRDMIEEKLRKEIQHLEELKRLEKEKKSSSSISHELHEWSTYADKWGAARKAAGRMSKLQMWCADEVWGTDLKGLQGEYIYMESEGSTEYQKMCKPPFYRHKNKELWLYVATSGAWVLGTKEHKDELCQGGLLFSDPVKPGVLPHEVHEVATWTSVSSTNHMRTKQRSVRFWLPEEVQVAWQELRVEKAEHPVLEVEDHGVEVRVRGKYELAEQDDRGEAPVFRHQQHLDWWLFFAKDRQWWIGNTLFKDDKERKQPGARGFVHSTTCTPGTRPEDASLWRVAVSDIWQDRNDDRIEIQIYQQDSATRAIEKWAMARDRAKTIQMWGATCMRLSMFEFDKSESEPWEPPVFRCKTYPNRWLYYATDGCWWVGTERKNTQGYLHSNAVDPGTLPHEVASWTESICKTFESNPGICIFTPEDAARRWQDAINRRARKVIKIKGAKAAHVNGLYDLHEEETGSRKSFGPSIPADAPSYQQQVNRDTWLYLATDGRWWVGRLEDKDKREPRGRFHSMPVIPGMLPTDCQSSDPYRFHKDAGMRSTDFETKHRCAWQSLVDLDGEWMDEIDASVIDASVEEMRVVDGKFH